MQRVYFDNAATTPIDSKVLEAIMPFFTEYFGNPSSIYSYGREARLAIENSRKSVAAHLHAQPGEIFFTSGGTESNNTAITIAIRDLGCKHIITSPIEHHAVLNTVKAISNERNIPVSFVKLLPNGHIDLQDLEHLLAAINDTCLVSLMHANNEIGNLLSINAVSALCRKYDAIFHSDCVQTVGHYPIDLSRIDVDFIAASGHKFHGPKGTGILYINNRNRVNPFLTGGGQERNMRAGTENIYGIIGFAKALDIAMQNFNEDAKHILSLKEYMMKELLRLFPVVSFNGDATGSSLYTILSVNFPLTEKSEMLLFNLDIHNVCASGGSACSSGAQQGSHVINTINVDAQTVTVRFSFSKYNTKEEVESVICLLRKLL